MRDIDVLVKGGQTLANFGGTGSGKTTMVHHFPRFYDVEKGAVRVDGEDVKAVDLKKLHEAVAFVPTKANLYSGSVRDNMKYGNENATDDDIWHALEIAQARDFIEEYPEGLDYTVETGGGHFSGGTRQRSAIARALVKDADFYVFDDSFTALDLQTDANLRAALKADAQILTQVVVIVGLRVSTVADADTIVVSDEGKMVGKGTHAELKAQQLT